MNLSVSAPFIVITLAGTSLLSARAATPDFEREIRPLVEARCIKCHSEKKTKGGVDFTLFKDTSSALKKQKVWRNALEQIETKEMPPEDEEAMPDAERAKLAGAIKGLLALLDSDDPATRDPGPPLLRRLTRVEYNLTIRDLTGLDGDAAESVGMPDDTPVTGFATFAAGQTLSAALMEKYFAAADKLIERLKVAAEPSAKKFDKDRAALDALFAGLPGAMDERAAAEKFIAGFARRAFRRPAKAEELAKLIKLYEAAAKKEPFVKAALSMLKPVLVSPAFLFRAEKDGDGKEPHRISDLELATRLSYFLWSTAPDETLLALAEQNKLSDEKVLDEQVKRMLASPKAKALAENFGSHWLQFRKVNEARPSTEFFPAFNGKLRAAMYSETLTFFDKLREEDRSVLELLDSDYTYVNEPLAKLYGIDGVKGEKLQRVSLKPELHRGGLLGMGSILALTSHTNRTSPTQRGKWVLEVLFANPPPPPPANAGQFKDDNKKGRKEPKDFREKLAMHATEASCAACHKKIDPLGFGLENFDAIGMWRESGKGIDASAQLPGGEKFNGVGELKKIVIRRQDEFERGMIGSMLSYAIGRELDWYDERVVTGIKKEMETKGHTYSALVMGIVKSYPMRYRR